MPNNEGLERSLLSENFCLDYHFFIYTKSCKEVYMSNTFIIVRIVINVLK